MDDAAQAFLLKAHESLSGAESEFTAGRLDNCADRCFYACLHSTLAALLLEEIDPLDAAPDRRWALAGAQFNASLIRQLRIYPEALGSALASTMLIRHIADHGSETVNTKQALESLQTARELVAAVRTRFASSGREVLDQLGSPYSQH